MDEMTAMTIGREWLRSAGASEDRLVAVTNTLGRIAAAPDMQHAVASDGRLALLAEKELWVGKLDPETESVTTVKIERVDLDMDRVRLSLTESHDLDPDQPGVTYTWRADFEHGTKPLEFQAKGQYDVRGAVHVREGDKADLAFGWHLAEATGWTKPN